MERCPTLKKIAMSRYSQGFDFAVGGRKTENWHQYKVLAPRTWTKFHENPSCQSGGRPKLFNLLSMIWYVAFAGGIQNCYIIGHFISCTTYCIQSSLASHDVRGDLDAMGRLGFDIFNAPVGDYIGTFDRVWTVRDTKSEPEQFLRVLAILHQATQGQLMSYSDICTDALRHLFCK